MVVGLRSTPTIWGGGNENLSFHMILHEQWFWAIAILSCYHFALGSQRECMFEKGYDSEELYDSV